MIVELSIEIKERSKMTLVNFILNIYSINKSKFSRSISKKKKNTNIYNNNNNVYIKKKEIKILI
jgi:hypothetical protein